MFTRALMKNVALFFDLLFYLMSVFLNTRLSSALFLHSTRSLHNDNGSGNSLSDVRGEGGGVQQRQASPSSSFPAQMTTLNLKYVPDCYMHNIELKDQRAKLL